MTDTGWIVPEDGIIDGVTWQGRFTNIDYGVDSGGCVYVDDTHAVIRTGEWRPRKFFSGKRWVTTWRSSSIYLPKPLGRPDFRPNRGLADFSINVLKSKLINEGSLVDDEFLLWVLGPAIEKMRAECDRLTAEMRGRGHLQSVAS